MSFSARPSSTRILSVVTIIRSAPSPDITEPVERWNLVSRSTTVFTNVFCTALILSRIVCIRGLRHSLWVYRGIIEILLESAILYTGVYLLYIGLDVYTVYVTPEWDQRYIYVDALLPAVIGVAPTLILARVAAGHAAPNDTWKSTSSFWRRELERHPSTTTDENRDGTLPTIGSRTSQD